MNGIVYKAKKHLEKLIEETKMSNFRDDDTVKAYREELITVYEALNKVMFCPDTLNTKSSKSILDLKNEKNEIEKILKKYSLDNLDPNEILVIITNYINVMRQIEQKCFICDFLH